MRRKKGKTIIFVVYLVFAVYLANFSIDFIKIPEFILKYNNIIFLISGILLLIGGINYLRVMKRQIGL